MISQLEPLAHDEFIANPEAFERVVDRQFLRNIRLESIVRLLFLEDKLQGWRLVAVRREMDRRGYRR